MVKLITLTPTSLSIQKCFFTSQSRIALFTHTIAYIDTVTLTHTHTNDTILKAYLMIVSAYSKERMILMST